MTQTHIPAKQAAYQLVIGSDAIGQRLRGRLESLTLTEQRGQEADDLEIVLLDDDGNLDIPRRGVKIHAMLGWQDTGLINKGYFVVDEVEHTGTPDKLTIRARSADLRTGLISQQERSWHQVTVGDIVNSIAKQNDLTSKIDQALASEPLAHIDQTNESDANLLTRLATMFDALFSVKHDTLIFAKKNAGSSVSGIPLQRISITRQDGDNHHFKAADREMVTGVKALYENIKAGTKGEVIYRGHTADAKSKLSSSADNIKILRHSYANEANAKRAARAEYQKIQRGHATLSLSLAQGRPEIFPELPATVSGWKPVIDSTEWLVTKITHTLDGSGGLSGDIEMELKV